MSARPALIRAVASFLAAAALATFLPVSPVRAQCMPDGLTGPCRAPASTTLPAFPAVTQQKMKFICFKDCATQLSVNLCATIGAPKLVNQGGLVCGLYQIPYTIKLCGGAGQVLWSGKLRAQYSRNWLETNPAGNAVGVWRFIINGDLIASTFLLTNAGTNQNVVPACYATFNNLYVGGYIDYALECGPNTWSTAWVLDHECDSIHHPLGSPRPAPSTGLHPNRSFTFVGPGTGFVIDPVTTTTGSGPLTSEAVRWNSWATLPNICTFEEPNVPGPSFSVNIVGSFCPCGSSSSPAQYDQISMLSQFQCFSRVITLTPPPVPFLQKRIGRWTVATTYPGPEQVNFDVGELYTSSFCTMFAQSEFYEGTTTVGGWAATDYALTPLGTEFMDLASSNKNPSNLVEIIGVPHVSTFVLNIGMP